MKKPPRQRLANRRRSERGNILFIILMAIMLIGLLTAVIAQTNNADGNNIDDETLAIRASEVQRYAGELERGIVYIMQSGISESDLGFAHPEADADYGDLSADADPKDQLFHKDGGAATYRLPPEDVLASPGAKWEFFGGSAIPGIGTSKPDLVAVLPGVTQQFCEKINSLNGLTGQPLDTGSTSGASGASAGNCINLLAAGRFGNSGAGFYDASRNAITTGSFSKVPAPQGCVQCNGIAGTPYHFYHVLLAR